MYVDDSDKDARQLNMAKYRAEYACRFAAVDKSPWHSHGTPSPQRSVTVKYQLSIFVGSYLVMKKKENIVQRKFISFNLLERNFFFFKKRYKYFQCWLTFFIYLSQVYIPGWDWGRLIY